MVWSFESEVGRDLFGDAGGLLATHTSTLADLVSAPLFLSKEKIILDPVIIPTFLETHRDH